MPTNRTIQITLPEEAAKVMESKIASGKYASESEFISESILDFAAREEDLDDWLRSEVVPVLDAMDADPSRGLTVDQVRSNLARRHENFRRAG